MRLAGADGAEEEESDPTFRVNGRPIVRLTPPTPFVSLLVGRQTLRPADQCALQEKAVEVQRSRSLASLSLQKFKKYGVVDCGSVNYINFVAREEDGRLRKVPVPLHYAYIFVAAAVVGLFTITGLAGSYTRMLVKTAHFNEVRSQQEALRHDYLHMQEVAKEKDIQAASLGSLANQITALYGLRRTS